MQQYGDNTWEKLWEQLEQNGNVGIDYVINPSLYQEIVGCLAKTPKALVVDFGCGTNVMGIQVLFGYKNGIPALKNIAELDHARFNTLLYIGVEGSTELVSQSHKYLRDLGSPKQIATVQSHIDKTMSLFDEQSIELCVSRNFLMHLPASDFSAHLEYVSKILKSGGRYIFTTLNPAYELDKVGRVMQQDEKYDFAHGAMGEYGVFYHYFKTAEFIDSEIAKYFVVEKKTPCRPIDDRFIHTYERYYRDEPMAYTYVLQVK